MSLVPWLSLQRLQEVGRQAITSHDFVMQHVGGQGHEPDSILLLTPHSSCI